MDQIENNESNRDELANDIIEGMDMKDLIQHVYQSIMEYYDNLTDGDFNDEWRNHYG